jgi:hypothetical protein
MELVALSALTLTPASKMPLAAMPPAGARGATGGRIGSGARDDLVERLRQFHGVRVLERQHVDLALSGLRYVETLDDLEDAHVRAFGRHDHERVRAVIGNNLGDVQVTDADRGRSSTFLGGPALTSKSSFTRLAISDADA